MLAHRIFIVLTSIALGLVALSSYKTKEIVSFAPQPVFADANSPITSEAIDGALQNISGAEQTGGSETIKLEVDKAKAASPVNFIKDYPTSHFAGDLAWGKPTFASSHWEEYYPSQPTTGKGGWRSAGSDGTWFYVDLGKPEQFNYIILKLYVDENFTQAPETSYIASNDKETWQVIHSESNTENVSKRGQYRLIKLNETATARYVGILATDWGGGWASIYSFTVLP